VNTTECKDSPRTCHSRCGPSRSTSTDRAVVRASVSKRRGQRGGSGERSKNWAGSGRRWCVGLGDAESASAHQRWKICQSEQ
jgi:hypothetical protein